MAQYQIVYWYDIPLQVKARDENGRFSVPLSPRFQEAADQAAMAAGLTTAEKYIRGMNQSRRQQRVGSAAAVARAVAAELEAQHEQIDWRQTAVSIRAQQQEDES